MEFKEKGLPATYAHDFFTNRPWLFKTCGYSVERPPVYRAYVGCLFGLHLYVEAMALYACYIAAPNKELIIGATHILLDSQFAVWGLIARILCDRSLHKTRQMALAGIYTYEDVDLEDQQKELLGNIVSEIRRKSNIFILIFGVCSFSNMVYFPLSQLVVLPADVLDRTPEIVNPFLPIFIYIPFSTKTVLGYCAAYLMVITIFLFIYGVAVSMNEIYVSNIVQIKVHLQVLNYSIRNMHKRALQLFKKQHGQLHEDLPLREMLRTREFQGCMYTCLRANLRHHQAILRFQNTSQLFNGTNLLITVTLASIIYATLLYLIYQNPPINCTINFIATFIAEATYSYYVCIYGQEIIDESSKLYMSLYDTSWMDCDYKFNSTLRIMMSNTLKPMQIKAFLMDFSASLKTFSDVL